jgi:hypothetical protein
VPFENIRLAGAGHDEGRRRLVEVDEFLHRSLVSGQLLRWRLNTGMTERRGGLTFMRRLFACLDAIV